MNGHQNIDKAFDFLSILLTNSIVYFTVNYATPMISFTTASLSLFYIIVKIKKEFKPKEDKKDEL